MDYTGTAGNDTFQFGAADNGATAYGLGGNDILRSYASGGNRLEGGDGNDTLIGGIGNDQLYGGNGDDFLNGQDGDNIYVGGLGNDTVMLLGNRADWVFSTSSSPGAVYGWSELYQIEAQTYDVETFDFVLSNGEPDGAFINTRRSETFTGTAERDVFFYDAALNLKIGYDTINNFEFGDVLVTTNKLADYNQDLITYAQYGSNGYHIYNDAGASEGRVAINNSAGAIGALELGGEQVIDGITYYIYRALGDTYSPLTLDI